MLISLVDENDSLNLAWWWKHSNCWIYKIGKWSWQWALHYNRSYIMLSNIKCTLFYYIRGNIDLNLWNKIPDQLHVHCRTSLAQLMMPVKYSYSRSTKHIHFFCPCYNAILRLWYYMSSLSQVTMVVMGTMGLIHVSKQNNTVAGGWISFSFSLNHSGLTERQNQLQERAIVLW